MDILAIDFGGSSVKYGLVNGAGELIGAGRRAAPLLSKEEFVRAVEEIYRSFGDRAAGVSISMPGYIETETGTLTGSGAYRCLYGCSLREMLGDVIPVKIAVENDGKCGALAEVWKGALADCLDGIVMILGSGIAGGVIKNRRIHSGLHGTAGEFSDYLVRPEDPTFCGLAVMNCASFGLTYKLCKAKDLDLACQDCAAELQGTDASFGGRYPAKEGPKRKIKADGKQLVKWLEEGDETAARIYGEFLGDLAGMIFNLQIVYAPQKVVIGGGLSRIPGLAEALRERLAELYLGTGVGRELQAVVEKSRYLDEGNLIGAAYHYRLCFGGA